MSRFVDGPAEGKSLLLRRAPKLLRVTRSDAGEIDALDQLDDRPKPNETITVYERVTTPSTVHINMRGGCGRYQIADYRQTSRQPDDATARSTAAWRAWASTYMDEHRSVNTHD